MPHQQNGIKKNGPKQPTSPVSTHGEVVKTNKSETFDAMCFDPSVNIGRRRPQSGHVEGPLYDVPSSISVERAARGKYVRSICLISPTKTPSADQISENRYERQRCNQTLNFSVPHACSRTKRAQIIFRSSFPIVLPHFCT